MRGLLVLVVGCVLLAGCAGLAPEGDTTPEQPSDGGPKAPNDGKQSTDGTDTTEKPGDPESGSTSNSEQSPAEAANATADEGSHDDTTKLTVPQNRSDPTNGTLGWYDGYWYDDPVAVNTTDGLNRTEREAVIARTMARVEAIRGLPFEESVDIEVISREQFRDRRSGGDGSSGTTGTKTLEAVRDEALFLVGDSGDAGKQRETNRDETVGGFYSTASGDIVLVSAGDTPRIDIQTLAHELTHALQDQQFDLTGTLATDTHDRSQARLALIEGDANYVMYTYDDRCGEFWTCLEYPTAGGGGGGDQPDIHMGLYLDSFFPYADGPAFVDALRDGGGWEPVNLAYDDPPETTREIITPEEYGTFEPSHVTIEERSTEQWTQVQRANGQASEVVGRAGLSVMFAYTIYHSANPSRLVSPAAFLNVVDGDVDRFDPLNYDLALTQGWVGDRLRAYERGNETAYVWKIAWESPDDARRFLSGYRQLLQYREGKRVTDTVWTLPQSSPFSGSIRVTADKRTVTIVNAPTRESLSAVHDTGS